MVDNFNLSAYRKELAGIRGDLDFILNIVTRLDEKTLGVSSQEVYSVKAIMSSVGSEGFSSIKDLLNKSEFKNYLLAIKQNRQKIIEIISGDGTSLGLKKYLDEQERKIGVLFSGRPLDPVETKKIRYEIISEYNQKIISLWRELRVALGLIESSVINEVDIAEQNLDSVASVVNKQFIGIKELIDKEMDLDILYRVRNVRDLLLPFKDFMRSAFLAELIKKENNSLVYIYGNDISQVIKNFFITYWDRINSHFLVIDEAFNVAKGDLLKIEEGMWKNITENYYALCKLFFAGTSFASYFDTKRDIIPDDLIKRSFNKYLDLLIRKISKVYSLELNFVRAKIGEVVLEGVDKKGILSRAEVGFENDVKISGVIQMMTTPHFSHDIKTKVIKYVAILREVVSNPDVNSFEDKFVNLQPCVGGNPIADRDSFKFDRLKYELEHTLNWKLADFKEGALALLNLGYSIRPQDVFEKIVGGFALDLSYTGEHHDYSRDVVVEFRKLLEMLPVFFDKEKADLLKTGIKELESSKSNYKKNKGATKFIDSLLAFTKKYYINKLKAISGKLGQFKTFYFPDKNLQEIWNLINEDFSYISSK